MSILKKDGRLRSAEFMVGGAVVGFGSVQLFGLVGVIVCLAGFAFLSLHWWGKSLKANREALNLAQAAIAGYKRQHEFASGCANLAQQVIQEYTAYDPDNGLVYAHRLRGLLDTLVAAETQQDEQQI